MTPEENPNTEPIETQEETIDPPRTDPWEMPAFVNNVVLADGTTMEGYATLYEESDELWVKITQKLSFPDAYDIFSNPEKTSKIISHTSILTTDEYYGYTKLTLIKQEVRTISVRLKLGK